MKVSLNPFAYILVFKSMRFLTLFAAPATVIVGIALSKLSGTRKRTVYMVLILDPHVSKYYYASTIGSLAYYNTFDSVLYKVVK